MLEVAAAAAAGVRKARPRAPVGPTSGAAHFRMGGGKRRRAGGRGRGARAVEAGVPAVVVPAVVLGMRT